MVFGKAGSTSDGPAQQAAIRAVSGDSLRYVEDTLLEGLVFSTQTHESRGR